MLISFGSFCGNSVSYRIAQYKTEHGCHSGYVNCSHENCCDTFQLDERAIILKGYLENKIAIVINHTQTVDENESEWKEEKDN